MRIVSPYTCPQRWLKGNFHTHTDASDGRATVDEVVAAYRNDNYDFLSITDHRLWHGGANRCAGDMLLIPGQECHIKKGVEAFQFHIVGLGVTRQVEDQATGQAIIDAINAAGGIAIVAHPRWSFMPYETFAALKDFAAFEVFNGGCTDVHRADSTDYWDWFLMNDRGPLYGAGCDDMHKLEHDFALGWTWVNAEKEQASIIDAIGRGDFYASGGPRIENIEVTASSITLYTTSARLVKWMSTDGTVVRWVEGKHVKSATFEPTGKEPYVRAEVVAHDGTTAWTNPFFIET